MTSLHSLQQNHGYALCLRSSTDTLSYTVPTTVTKFGERAFSVAGPSVWNSQPADIRHITDTSVFKRHLKAHF